MEAKRIATQERKALTIAERKRKKKEKAVAKRAVDAHARKETQGAKKAQKN